MYKTLSQACAVGQSKFQFPVQTAGRTTKASDVWFSYSHTPVYAANGAIFHSVYQVRPVAVLPEVFSLSKCARL